MSEPLNFDPFERLHDIADRFEALLDRHESCTQCRVDGHALSDDVRKVAEDLRR